MSYSEKLKDPRWQKCRLRVMERDGFVCRECGDGDKTLHVHHLYYMKGLEPWEYEGAALITLCDRCHAFAEVRSGYVKRNIGRILGSTSLSAAMGEALIKAIADYAYAASCAGEQHNTVASFLNACAQYEQYEVGVRAGADFMMSKVRSLGLGEEYDARFVQLCKSKGAA